MSTPTISFRPAALNLEFVAGDDVPVPLVLELEDDAGAVLPYDLTGATVAAYVEDGKPGNPVPFAVEVTDAAAGKVTCTLASAASTALNTSAKTVKLTWFLQVTGAAGRRTLITGSVAVLSRI